MRFSRQEVAMDYRIEERLPTPEEYQTLRKSVGWRERTQESVRRGLPGSLYGVCAYADQTLVGMARIIGDGGLVYYIQDVIVIPEFQKHGIGARMMDKIMGYIKAHASRNSVIGLMAAKGVEPFYEKYGFLVRPNDRYGSGMTIFWSVEDPAGSPDAP
jgi:GNAT superfamily N-acetyltransferase